MTCGIVSRLCVVIASAATLVLVAVSSASAATVTNTNDSGEGSLRAAIASEDSVITFGPETVGVGGIALLSALPELSHDVDIQGPGADQLAVGRIPVVGDFRIFTVPTGAQVTISGLGIVGGRANVEPAYGGGIWNEGSLRIEETKVLGNSAGKGGGIYNAPGAGLSVFDSTISNNQTFSSVTQDGGGILNSGTLSVWNSLISDNYATGTGGAVYTQAGGATQIVNSTIVNNDARFTGGIVGAYGAAVRVENSTVVANIGPPSRLDAANLNGATVSNSIVADPRGGAENCKILGVVQSEGYNLESSNSCGFDEPTDLTSTDPLLGPLTNNGGSTDTMALLPGSPAIDCGLNRVAAVDQRGLPRVVDHPSIVNASGGNGADIGAFEVQTTTSVVPGACLNRTDEPPGGPPGGPPGAPSLDTDAPETEITKGAPNRLERRKVKFKFSADEPGSTFECKLDKKQFKPCTSPRKFQRLDDGKHKFKVVATDEAGNTDPSPAGDRFKVVD